jgi:preprotein translocase subunit SecF
MQDTTVVNTQPVKYKIDFLKYRYIWIAISLIYLLIGGVAYVIKGGFRYSIDFTGGAELRVAFEQPTDISKIRTVMGNKGWKDAIIQSIGSTNKEFLIRIGSMDSGTEKTVKNALDQEIANNKVRIDNVQWVGSEVGKDTTRNAIIAVLLALVILLLYIAMRFEFRFGIGAVASLIHDVLAVLVFLLLTEEPMSQHILASVLAILGYSLNDTIVIFSRIRENLKKMRGIPEYDIVNISINQTLKRTLLTSFATMLSVLSIVIWGGETLRGLSIVMLVGIIVGTYSSIYIASPAMLAIKTKRNVE